MRQTLRNSIDGSSEPSFSAMKIADKRDRNALINQSAIH